MAAGSRKEKTKKPSPVAEAKKPGGGRRLRLVDSHVHGGIVLSAAELRGVAGLRLSLGVVLSLHGLGLILGGAFQGARSEATGE